MRTSNTKSASIGTPRLKPKDSNTSVSEFGSWSSSLRTSVRRCEALSWLVSITSEYSRSSDSSSRSCSIASIRARRWSWFSRRDSGCSRRVSEKRRTSVSVVASRNSTVSGWPPLRSFWICAGTPGSDLALRTSIAIATRSARCSRSIAMKSASSSGGRLSTQ